MTDLRGVLKWTSSLVADLADSQSVSLWTLPLRIIVNLNGTDYTHAFRQSFKPHWYGQHSPTCLTFRLVHALCWYLYRAWASSGTRFCQWLHTHARCPLVCCTCLHKHVCARCGRHSCVCLWSVSLDKDGCALSTVHQLAVCLRPSAQYQNRVIIKK